MKLTKKTGIFIANTVMLLAFSASLSFAAEHSHNFDVLYTVNPTCIEKGYTVFSCECGESYEGNEVNSLGHDFSEDMVCFKKPTCTEKGESGRYCQRCYTKTDVIYSGKSEHLPVTRTEKATLNKNGKTVSECRVCKKLFSSKSINKITSVKLSKSDYTYDGKVKAPEVTVKDSKGKALKADMDYSVKYQKGRKKTGSYSVKVTFKGDYKGEKTLYFNIRPTAVKNISASPSLSSVNLSWNKSKGADGYEICLGEKVVKTTENTYCTINKIEGKKLGSGKDYTFVIKSYKKSGDKKIYSESKKVKVCTKPAKAKIKKISKATVTAAKQSCHGYEFLLSTNKSFSNASAYRVKGKDNNTYSYKKLARGKKYYVKIRAYVVYGGKKHYGYYSEVKSFYA